MAHHAEPMDVDCLDSDFDNKENFHHSNVLPCTEKGYEELDVSELNMKLRYSITPATSPMSKSYTADDTRNLDSDDSFICTNENSNLTRSLNSTMTRNDSVIKSLKALPLQTISTEVDHKCISVLRQLGSTTVTDNNVTVTISEPNDDENISLPSSSSSTIHTPEATTPTKLCKNEEGSTIIRGLKTVFNMFRSSQSPVASAENNNIVEQLVGSLDETYCEDLKSEALASTPIAAHRNREGSTKSSPLKDSITFNDDLEKELQWKEDATLSIEEKLPIQKLFPHVKPIPGVSENLQKEQIPSKDLNSNPVEYMDISYNNSMILDSTVTEVLNTNGESDSEFVDCETTFTKNEPQEMKNKAESHKQSDAINNKDIVNNNQLTGKDNGTTENEKDKASSACDMTKNENNSLADTKDYIIKLDENNHLTEGVLAEVEYQTKASVQEVFLGVVTLEASNEIINSNESKEGVISDKVDKNLEVVDESRCEIGTVVCETDPAETVSNFKVKNIETSTHIELGHIPTEIQQEAVNLPINATVPCLNEISLLEQKLEEGSTAIENLNISNEIIQTDMLNLEVDAEQPMLEKYISDGQIVDVNKSNYIETDEAKGKGIVPNMECPANKEEVESIANKRCNLSSNLTYNTKDNTDNTDTVKRSCQDSKKIDEVLEPTQLLERAENHVMHALAPSDLLAEEPADIPLPEDEDFDSDLGHNTPDVLDNIKTEENLDVTLKSTNLIQNVTGEIPENHDLLDETNAIVNSLTEIIGESQNNSTVLANDTFEHSISELMDSVEFSGEENVLPDLVNQTINNMTIENINVPNLNQPVDDSKNNNTPYDEKKSDINDQSKFTFDTAVADNTNARNSESFTQDKELIVGVEDASGIIKDCLSHVEIVRTEKVSQDDNVVEIKEISKTPIVDEELLLSLNNSPYVSVIAETESKSTDESSKNIDIPINATKEAPSSPPIRSKGYNFNFDEIDDPFASKTKISLSPPPSPSILEEKESEKEPSKKSIPNRRRSQPPERKRPPFNKKFNTTLKFSSSIESPINKLNDQNSKGDSKKEIGDDIKTATDTVNMDISLDNEVADILDPNIVLNTMKIMGESIDASSEKEVANTQTDYVLPSQISMDSKKSIESMPTTKSDIKLSSSEQSTYYSATTSSNDSIQSRNVFNLPEIDDINFSPFATKSKMRQSPQHNFEPENPFTTSSQTASSPDTSKAILSNSENIQLFVQKSKDAEDKMDTELMEKDSAYNITNTTSSFKGIDDMHITAREVNTDDEDTVEGPFLEAEDANLLDIDEDLLQFNENPTHANEENADGGELFIDAEAFEFLLNKNQTNVVADSGKESLFLKFDPLFAKRISSDGVLAALKHVQKRLSTPIKPSMPTLKNEASPIAGPSTMNTTYEGETNVTQDSIEDLNVTVAKPMMVVTPAVNPAVTSRNKTTSPPRSNRRSFTFTSPAMAVIDRLLSLSGNNSFLGHDTTVTQSNREHSEAEIALSHLRELLAEKEQSVDQLRTESKELNYRLSTMETQVKLLEADGNERLSKINKLNERLAEKTKINKSMAAVVEEYERTIASLIADTEQDKKRHAEERIRLINERDEQTSHLASMEVSFSDLHSKYEKSKQIILSCKASEETCKKSIKEFEENLAKMQTNYEMLKQHATSKLNQANQELQKINKAHESDILKLNAMIKRKDMHITSLEETLLQKTKANEELTAICDELINKVA